MIKKVVEPARGRTGPKEENTMKLEATLSAKVIRKNGKVKKLGVIATRQVTTAFVNLLVDDLQASQAAFHAFKYHDSGTGVGAEDPGDTGLGTATGLARVIGTQEEGASANIYKSVGTITYDNTYAITEHGLFSAASGATLMDRSKFTAISVVLNDKIEFTYQLTCTAGG